MQPRIRLIQRPPAKNTTPLVSVSYPRLQVCTIHPVSLVCIRYVTIVIHIFFPLRVALVLCSGPQSPSV